MLVILWVMILFVVMMDKFWGILMIGVGVFIEFDWLNDKYCFFIIMCLGLFWVFVIVVLLNSNVVVIVDSWNFKLYFLFVWVCF